MRYNVQGGQKEPLTPIALIKGKVWREARLGITSIHCWCQLQETVVPPTVAITY